MLVLNQAASMISGASFVAMVLSSTTTQARSVLGGCPEKAGSRFAQESRREGQTRRHVVARFSWLILSPTLVLDRPAYYRITFSPQICGFNAARSSS